MLLYKFKLIKQIELIIYIQYINCIKYTYNIKTDKYHISNNNI